MNNQKSTSRSKKSSGLKSKHLLVALFAVAVGAVCGAVVGLMQTSVHSDANLRAAASAAKEGTVEVWAPRGASAPAAATEPVQQATVETAEQQKTEEAIQASQPEAQAEIAAASSPATAEKPQKTASNRVQRKKTVQKKVNEAQTQAAAPSETPTVQLPQAKAPETAVTAVKSADEVPAAPQPKPQPATEEPAVAKEPPREPPKAVVTDNLF